MRNSPAHSSECAFDGEHDIAFEFYNYLKFDILICIKGFANICL